MNDIQQTWLEKESHGDASFENGAFALKGKIRDWIQHIENEGIASPYVVSALWELDELIETWCGIGNASNNAAINDGDVW